MSRPQFSQTLHGGPAIVNVADLVPTVDDDGLLAASSRDMRLPNPQSRGSEIVFVDAGIDDLATLLAGLQPGAEVIMLDSSSDAIGQIATALAGHDSLDAIHIIANGAEGRIAFGAGSFGLADLGAHADDLAAIGDALGADGDLLLWSCDTGLGTAGQDFLDALARATGADVAASTDQTGAAARGGNWVLEAHSGAIQAHVPLTPGGIEHFDGLLDNTAPALAFAASPVGGELIVNADTAGSQQSPAVATLSGGGYVAVWYGSGPGDSSGIFVQRFDASGTPVGGEVRANTTTNFTQSAPSVAGLSDGSYVVAWHSFDQDALITSVFMQRYDASGNALGGEVQVDSDGSPSHAKPSIAALDGSYVVVWNGNGPGDLSGIFMQRYDNAGNALGVETLVNSFTPSDQTDAAVATLSDGGFIVAWGGNGPDDGIGIFARRFDASGAAVGSQFTVNTETTGGQYSAAVAGLSDGGYVIAWQGNGTGDADGVYAQRYDAAGAAVGSAVLVNTTASRAQSVPSVAGLADGGYLVTWQHDGGTNLIDVYSQRYDASGAAVGGETQVATLTSHDQTAPAVTAASDGGYFVAWQTEAQEGDGAVNIAAQLFGVTLTATEQVAHDLKGEINISDADAGDTLTVTLAVDYGVLHLAEGTSGATIVSGNDSDSVIVSGTAAQIQALLGSDATSVVTFTADTDIPPDSATLTVTVDDGGGPVSDTTAITIVAVNDAPELDLDFYTAGNDATLSWHSGDGPTAIAYGAFFTDDNTSYDGATVTADFTANGATGDELTILSVGDGPGEIRIDGSDIYYEGTLVGSFTGGTNGDPLVATFNADACHCSIQMVIDSIAFDNAGATPDTTDRTVTITLVDGGGTDIGGHDTASADVVISIDPANMPPTIGFTPYEAAPGGEVLVNTTTNNSQSIPATAGLEGGGHVIVWTGNGVGDTFGVFMQRYDASGAPLGSEVRVNTTTAGLQSAPTIAAVNGGGYIVAWQSPDAAAGGIHAQLFDASGAAIGGEVLVNTYTAGNELTPSAAGLSDGGYVITWSSSIHESVDVAGGEAGIYLQRYDATGAAVGGEIHVNTTEAGNQIVPVVAALGDGGYVVTWQSSNDIYSQRFDASGAPSGAETVVSAAPSSTERDPVITALSDGGYVIAWEATARDGDEEGIYAQRYDASGAAVGSSFQVNSFTTGAQTNPAITALRDGGYVIAWQSDSQDGSAAGTYAQRYDAAGIAVGGEQLINTTTTNSQGNAAIAGLADGSYFIAWSGNGIGDSAGIFTQRFDANFAATEGVALDIKGHVALGDVDDSGGTYTLTLSVAYGELAVDAGTSGVSVDDSDPHAIAVTGTLAQLQALLGSDPTSHVTFTTEDDFPPATADLEVSLDDGFDTTTDTATILITPVNDAADLDLDFTTPGTDAVATYVAGDPATPIAYNATFDDDNANWDGATLTVAIAGATADDQLTIDVTFLPDISLVGSDILYQGDLVGSFTGGTNGDPLVVTFNADACACAIEEVTYGISYANSGTVSGSSTRDVTFTFVDGDGTANGGSDTATATVELTVTPGATPPVIDPGAAASGDEDSAIALTGITITDAGDPATGLVTVHLGVAHGTLTIRTDVPGGIDASAIVNDASGHGITIVATPDQINATLAANGLSYLGDAEFSGSDELTISANDGTPGTPLAISSLGAQPFFDFPSAVAFHDVDGDGLDDLILGLGDGTSSGGVLVLANGIGGFGLPSGAADAFAFGDFDGDGTDDIGVASYAADGSGYVAYYSSATGTLETIANVPYALDLIAGDFNGDGLMDLAAANSDSGNIAILLQTAPGVFAPPVYSSATSLLTVSIRTGDFNGDGKLDLLASNYGDSTGFAPPGSIDLFLGNGDGTFGAATQVWTGPSNSDGLVVADFNGDGYDDFAFASVDEAGVPGGVNGVQVVLGNGDGTFGAATGYVTTPDGRPARIVAGDLNGDGITDLVVTNSDDPGTVSILVGNGDGSFQAPVALENGDSPYVVALGDPDGDGDLDLIVGNAGDGTYEAFNNDDFHRGGTAVKPITVDAVNDAPTGTDATIFATEDSFYLLSLGDLGFSDVDSAFGSVTIGAVTGGKIYYDADGSAGAGLPVEETLPQTYTAQDLLDGKVSFKADEDANGVALGSITFTVIDDGGLSAAGSNTLTVDVTSVPDLAVAQADAVSTAENAVGTGNLFLDNGSGIDRDGDGDAFAITEINGSAANVGTTIVLASGAKLTVQADGSYSYNPNGKFTTLTDGSTGAVNTSATDSFTYTLTGGNTATVTVTVNGVAGPGDRLAGDGTDNTITGTGGGDFVIDTSGGDDDFKGMGGNDVFLLGATLTSADKIDGGAGSDQLAIQGDYSSQLTLGTGVTGVEYLAILPGSDTRFGDPGTNFYDYNIKTVNANVAAGVTFTVDANLLRAGEDFTFDGSAETDGKFFIYGGGGTDTLTGGAQNDTFYFGENGQFGADDHVTGGAGTDQLGLRGDYTIVFGADQLTGIESIGMVSAIDTRFGALGDRFDYDLTMNDGNVLSGRQMSVDAAALRAGETLKFDGSAELDGSFAVFGGAGNDVIVGSHGADTLVGWAGADTLTGGLGNDSFRYNLTTDSTSAARDQIQDFTLGDKIDLSRIDANSAVNGNQAFNFIGSSAFGHHAGELRYENVSGAVWMVQGDTNGDGIADFEIVVTVTDSHGFTGGDFLL